MANRKSPVIGDNGITATPEELRQITKHAIELFEAPAPDLHNPEEVKQAIYNYFDSCDRHGVRPANLGFYAALGLSKQDYNNIVTGKSKSKASPACIDLMQKTHRILSSYREALAMNGKVNPVTAIFWSKNFDGMTDSTTLNISADRGPEAQRTPSEIAKQIERDIPIDAEYTTE